MIVTVTTTTTALSFAAAGSLSLIVSLSLIALLIKRDIFGAMSAAWAQRVVSRINAVLPPLLAVFIVTIAVRVYDLLASIAGR
jgi:hypothetical protein